MIYICIPSYNEARTVGLLLWKIRQTFLDFPREYQLVVVNDGSTDDTAAVLAPYTNVLPLTLLAHPVRRGYAATVEELLRYAVAQTDRPRRDCAILMHADFSHRRGVHSRHGQADRGRRGPGHRGRGLAGGASRLGRWVRRTAPMLLRSAVRVPGVRDVCSGFAAFRLATLQDAFRSRTGPLLTTEGWVANAELYGRAARAARRVETCETMERRDHAGTREPMGALGNTCARSGAPVRRSGGHAPRGAPARVPPEAAG